MSSGKQVTVAENATFVIALSPLSDIDYAVTNIGFEHHMQQKSNKVTK